MNMTEAGNFENKNDDNDDIYEDIGDFHFDRELVKLEECNKAYSEDIERLSANVNQLTEKNTELQNVNDILTTNISILLKTAKAEIQRKQLVIDELRNKIEDPNGKKYYFKRDDLKDVGTCKVCGTKFSKDDVNDLEDGEIKNKSEEDDIKSEVGSHRNFKSKDKREHSGNHKRSNSYRRSRGRSSDKYSRHNHRSSRRSEERRSHRSRSSRRSRMKYKSPDERRNYSRRKRSREKRSRSSSYVRKSISQKREFIPGGKEIHRRSEERHRSRRRKVADSCSRANSPPPKTSTKIEKNPESIESSSKPANSSENKTNVFRSDSNVIKNRTEEKENGKTESKKKEKSDDVKKLNRNDYHERSNSNGNVNNHGGKKCDSSFFTRESVLADLYDETNSRSQIPHTERPKNHGVVSEYGNNAANCVDSSSDESWTLSFHKKPEVLDKPKTVYSRRMELRIKQKLLEGEMDSKDKRVENNSSNQDKHLEEKPICAEEEKEEGEITFENDEDEQVAADAVQKDAVSENVEEAPITVENSQVQNKHSVEDTCTDVEVECEKPERAVTDKDSERSLGENIVKKFLQDQKEDETLGIKEFSPLKNNYKLSKISPLKSVQKQHILEYYNLKPAHQLNNIEPEILDFSFTIPETPGKNFTLPFSTLDGEESNKAGGDENIKTFEEERLITKLNNNEDAEGNKKNDPNPAEVVETAAAPKPKENENGASPESKKSVRTRAKRKLRTAKEKQTDNTQVTPDNKNDKDPVTYQIRTRSRTGNESRKCAKEVNDQRERRGRTLNKNKSAPVKRKRDVLSSEEEADEEPKQKNMKKKVNSGAEVEMKKTSNEEPVEKVTKKDEKPVEKTETESEKGSSGSKAEEDTRKANEITNFEVFQSVPEATSDMMVDEKNPLEELSFSNTSDCRATNTSGSDSPNKPKCPDESKLSMMSEGNSDHSSTFKVLRSYLMLSANDESDVEVFSDDSNSSSGEYSDSGASAFVDLL